MFDKKDDVIEPSSQEAFPPLSVVLVSSSQSQVHKVSLTILRTISDIFQELIKGWQFPFFLTFCAQ